MENPKTAPRQVDHRGLPIDTLVEEEQRLKTEVTGGLKVMALIGLIAPIPIAFLVTATIIRTGDPGAIDHSWLTKMMVLALGAYWIGAWLLLLLIKTLMRRVRVLSILRVSLASIVCAATALAAAYLFFHSVDSKSGEGALGLLLIAFLIGGVVGILCVCITAFVLSRRHHSSRQSDSASQKANVLTVVLAFCTLPAAFLLFENALFMPYDPFTIALAGILIGIAGLRESFMPDVVKDSPRTTRILLWLGAAASILAAACFVLRFLNRGSLLHSGSVSTLVFVLGVVAIPAGFYVWRLLATRSSAVT